LREEPIFANTAGPADAGVYHPAMRRRLLALLVLCVLALTMTAVASAYVIAATPLAAARVAA
jgi:hypothetical protein